MGFFGSPTLPKDTFEFNLLKFYLNFDRHEKITEWNYIDPSGVRSDLESAGAQIVGLSLEQAWQKSAEFKGDAHAIYWQLGRLLGFVNVGLDNGDELVCRCFNVSKTTILQNLVKDKNYDLLSIGKSTKAGLGCGSCQKDITEAIQDYCDYQATVIAKKSKPKGVNPINFLLRLKEEIKSWQDIHYSELSLNILGIKDYTIYANWNEDDDKKILELEKYFLVNSRIKLKFEKPKTSAF